MPSYIVAYSHEDGYYVCPDCATEEEQDEETGLTPVFDVNEYVGASRPHCDRCFSILGMSFYPQCPECYGGPGSGDLERIKCPECLDDVYQCKTCHGLIRIRDLDQAQEDFEPARLRLIKSREGID